MNGDESDLYLALFAPSCNYMRHSQDVTSQALVILNVPAKGHVFPVCTVLYIATGLCCTAGCVSMRCVWCAVALQLQPCTALP